MRKCGQVTCVCAVFVIALYVAFTYHGSAFAQNTDEEEDLVAADADAELEACPRLGLTDEEIGACITRVFQRYMVPRLRQGIPELGVRSVDPITVPTLTVPILNIGLVRWLVHVQDLVLTGMATLSRSKVVFNTPNKTIDAHLTFPRIDCESSKVSTEGHAFGVPLRWFMPDGGVSCVLEGLSIAIFHRLGNNVTLLRVEYEQIDSFVAQAVGVSRPKWLIPLSNWFFRAYSAQLFEYGVRSKLEKIMTDVITSYLEPNVWNAILQEYT